MRCENCNCEMEEFQYQGVSGGEYYEYSNYICGNCEEVEDEDWYNNQSQEEVV